MTGSIDWDRVRSHIAALDDAAAASLAARLAEHLKYAAPVNPDTRQARKALKEGTPADPALLESLEALRDELDDEYFRLDAAEDEEAAAWFHQARAVSALTFALQGLHADAVYEASHTAEEPHVMLRELGLAPDNPAG